MTNSYKLNFNRLIKAEKLINLSIHSGTLYSHHMDSIYERAEFLAQGSIYMLRKAIEIQKKYVGDKDD